jgi:hypothetical protein
MSVSNFGSHKKFKACFKELQKKLKSLRRNDNSKNNLPFSDNHQILHSVILQAKTQMYTSPIKKVKRTKMKVMVRITLTIRRQIVKQNRSSV